jgi:hypothetical protein
MPKLKSNILSTVQVALPVRCEEEECNRYCQVHNTVFVPIKDEEPAIEAFGHGGEDPDHDNCPICKALGVLQDPLPVFLFDSPVAENRYVVVLPTPELLDGLIGVFNNYKEENSKGAVTVFDEVSAGFSFRDAFHVMDGEDFLQDDFEFNLHPYEERAKFIQCSKFGLRLSCEAEPKSDGSFHDNEEVYETPWLSKDDLLTLREWLVRRLSGS